MSRFELKYFRKIRTFEAAEEAAPPESLPPLDITPFLTRSSIKQRLVRWVFRKLLPALFWLLRKFWPVARIGRLVVVSRDADVREVLGRADAFAVPFGPEMNRLAGGTDSILGTEGAYHDRLRNDLMSVLSAADLPNIRLWSRGYADALLDASGGTIDVVTDLFVRVATETCGRYFGLTIHDPAAFAQWTMAVSGQLFADPFGDKETRALARNGAARIRAVIQDAIARVRANDALHPTSGRTRETLVDRLIGAGWSDGEIVANIMGLATGFIPTNTLAAGNMLEELLSDPERMADAKAAAAAAGGKGRLTEILLRAGSRNPALSPGQWRYVVADVTIAAGTRRCATIRKAADPDKPVVVLAAIASALRDRSDGANCSADPERSAELLFGWGAHSCLGRHVAMAQIVETFAALLTREELVVARGRHGWMQRMGPFPIRLEMSFRTTSSTQSMIIVSAPVTDGTALEAVSAEIEALGNPAATEIRQRLDETNIVHFASLSAIGSGHGESSHPIVLLELNVDGTQSAAIRSVAEAACQWLAPIMRHCAGQGEQLETAEQLATLLGRHALDLHCKPWGPIGIHYNGTPEFSVEDICRQERLAEFARSALDHYFKEHMGRRGRAMEALTRVRRFANQDAFLKLKQSGSWPNLFARGREFEFTTVRPSRRRLAIATWEPPKSMLAPLAQVVASRDGFRIVLLLTSLAIVASFVVGFAIDPPWLPQGEGSARAARTVSLVLSSALVGLALTATVVLGAVGLFVAILAWKERRDEIDDQNPAFDHVANLSRREDSPGYAQNHIIAVVRLKPGMFRKIVFAFSLWGIRQAILYWFRPGFVVTMGTIHYAKWFRVPGTELFVFLSNYDGSWESYLEDFITRAHWGQTAAWSNGQGFPRSRLLIYGGAQDGDRFKRWVRRQQQETRFWYSRYPQLTTREIRNNALIEDGLAHATSDTDARRWLGCFGSAQREDHEIETSEVQSIVFSGFGHLQHATCLLIRLPERPVMRSLWLRLLSGEKLGSAGQNRRSFAATPLLASRLLDVRGRPHRELRIAFGDNPPADGAAVLGLTAVGLQKLGLGSRDGASGLSQFPAAFNAGMAGRERALADSGSEAPARWRWRDGHGGGGVPPGVDAALIVYGQQGPATGATPATERHRSLVDLHCLFLQSLEGEIVDLVPMEPVIRNGRPSLHFEHFGFRDGISQPAIRGTQRAALGVPDRDLAQPGEFLLGYRNNQGFYPPLIGVGEEEDYGHDLPILKSGAAGRFPRFGSGAPGDSRRDFGRNGTFLVLRQLDQHVEEFHEATMRHAASITSRYDDVEGALGHKVDATWVAAKMVGRWPDGRPLVGNPPEPSPLLSNARRRAAAHHSVAPSTELRLENDFTYGEDDPRGHQCPLGAHIRRANPRDSLEPGDSSEQFISNRHRLLRRGRSYDYEAVEGAGKQKGLLFMALCADLERQFEFVQRSWIQSRSFHGLTGEGDPIASRNLDVNGGHGGKFTIPTPTGPITLDDVSSYATLRAGGYFFLPSLAALKFLARKSATPPAQAHSRTTGLAAGAKVGAFERLAGTWSSRAALIRWRRNSCAQADPFGKPPAKAALPTLVQNGSTNALSNDAGGMT